MMVLSKFIDKAAKAFAGNTALVCNEGRLSYFELSRQINIFTSYLSSGGVKHGERIAIYLPSSRFFVISLFAASKVGAAAVTFNTNYKADELRRYFKACGIRYVISDQNGRGACNTAIKGASIKFLKITQDFFQSSIEAARCKDIKVRINDEALCQFSSGSTGTPKIISRTNYNLFTEAESISKSIGISEKDKVLCAVPLFHAYGFGSAMMASIYSGATLVLLDKFNPRQVLRLLEKEKVTIFFGVPFMFRMLLDIAGDKKEADLSALRYCFSAGISLPEEVSRGFNQRFGIFVRDLYGTTETGCICVNLNDDMENRLNSVGASISGTKIGIAFEDGRKASPGEEGEIIVKTRTCAMWYYAGGIKKKLLKDGFLYTGDLGRVDSSGNLYISGRKTSFINVAGAKVDPEEIEQVLKGCPGIREAAVIGVPDRLRGQVVKAVIAYNAPNLDRKSVLRYCRSRIADFKVPRIIEFRKELPRSSLGKLLKGCL